MRGRIDPIDGIERITTDQLCDVLEIPRSRRGSKAYSRLSAVMADLGWTSVRIGQLKTRGFKRTPVR